MRRLHPLTAVIRIASIGFTLAFIVGAAQPVLSNQLAISLPAFGGPLGFAVGGLYGYLSYRRFTYELTDDTFDLGKGVLARTEREIPLGRVQNVDVERSILGQLLGLAVVRIETAGGGSTEATLSFVGVAEADRLQQGIRSRRAKLAGEDDRVDDDRVTADSTGDDRVADDRVADERVAVDSTADDRVADDRVAADSTADDRVADDSPDAAGETPASAPSPTRREEVASSNPPRSGSTVDRRWNLEGEDRTQLVTLRVTDLLLLAVTNFQLGSVIFLFFGLPFVSGFATDVLVAAAEPLGGPSSIDPARMTPDQYFVLGGVAGPLLALAGYVVSAVVAVQEYYDFELARRGDDLVYERGLIQRYSGSIPTDKIQTLTVTETAPMRVIGYAALDVETAGYAGGGANSGSQAAVPIATRDRVLALARDLFTFDDLALERPPRRARTRYAARYAIALTAILVVAYAIAIVVEGFTLWWMPALLFPVVPVAAHCKWRQLGYALDDDHVVVRSGFWRRRTHVVPYYRLQTIITEATVFQRRRHLASVVADTASSATLSSSSPTAMDLDADTASDLQNSLRARLQAHLDNTHEHTDSGTDGSENTHEHTDSAEEASDSGEPGSDLAHGHEGGSSYTGDDDGAEGNTGTGDDH